MTDIEVAQNIAICHRCEFSRPAAGGIRPCSRNGKDTIILATSGACPENKHTVENRSVVQVATAISEEEESESRPLPRDQWPKWAAWVSEHLKPEDVGVGDTVAAMLANEREFRLPFHLEKFAKVSKWTKAILKAAGVPCGCDERRERWNKLYPYTKE